MTTVASAPEFEARRTWSYWTTPGHRAVAVLAIVIAASALTLACGPSIRHVRFAFFDCAVVASAIIAGAPGGLFATIIGILIVDHRWLPPRDSLGTYDPPSLVAIAAFTVGSLIVTAIAARFSTQARQLAEAEERRRLLAEASHVLASSLDYEKTVAAVAELAVPDFADWCTVDLLVQGEIKRLAAAHADPAKLQRARELQLRFRPPPNTDVGIPAVIRTGEPVFAPVVTDDMLVAVAQSPEHLAMLRSTGIQSAIIVPITTRGLILGALTLVRSRAERRFDESDFNTAQAMGRRAAIAIDNARLYREARSASDIKSNFLATMSHELRTPLTAILGFEELLADGISGPVADGQRKPLQRIKASAMHLLALIEEILLFARLDAGDESVHADFVPVKHLVDEVMAFMATTLANNELTLRCEMIDPELKIRTDRAKLRQLLVSLLSNAVKFTTKGEIVVRAFERESNLIFEIQDTGVGIGPESLEHIFDAFWQVEQARTRKTGGSGLGLAVARRLARLLGGDITVDSTPSVGSTFRIALPKSPPA